jgi:deoxyribose-phosphate aldolase
MTADFGRYIDHSLLRPGATPADVARLCREARDHAMAAVCVFPGHVAAARKELKDTNVRVATVVAFPFGITFTEAKAAELRASAANGADEADIVLNVSQLRSGSDSAVEDEMLSLTGIARSLGVTTKFIVETGVLNDDEKTRVCRIANRVRPDFLKTSSGYAESGATVEDVRAMRALLHPEIRIKASGGIRSHQQAFQLLKAGASRIGTSSGVAIVEESRK